MRPKVLIITYYWPPTGGSGVQRWVKFAKYLRNFGWEPVIYTPSNPEMPAKDESLLKDIPKDIEVVKQPIWEPHDLYKRFSGLKKEASLGAGMASESSGSGFKQKLAMWVRGNFFIPDARKFWIKPSVSFLINHLKDHPVDAIVSTGPPHSMHMIARGVKKATQIPWIADFRDPWTNIDFIEELNLTTWGKASHAQMEKSVLTEATEVVAVTPTMAKELGAIVNRTVHVVTNGFDENDFQQSVSSNPHTGFTLLHIGTMNKARNPEMLWEAIKELCDEHSGFKEAFKLRLIGRIDSAVYASVTKYELGSHVDLLDYIPHDKIISEQQNADALLLLVNEAPNAYLLYQGKLFEYIASGRPILTIGPDQGDTKELLKELGQETYANFDDKEGLKSHLFNLYQDYEKGALAGVPSTESTRFSRKKLTQDITSILNKAYGHEP